MRYNWQLPDWPNFRYETSALEALLFEIGVRMGRSSGLLDGLTGVDRSEAFIEMMVVEALKTSEIEGEYLSRKDVMSSVRRNLGFAEAPPTDQRADGAAKLMVLAQKDFQKPLTADMLFEWHQNLMQGSKGVAIGQWRTHPEPMQVVSGALGKERVHFEAPPSSAVPEEMDRFIRWFNETAPGGQKEMIQYPLRAAITHLYFETIHPFEDGNGRIGRALSEKAISQGLGRPVLLSLSKAIEAKKKEYYHALQAAQTTNEISPWLGYFIPIMMEAQVQAEELVDFTVKKVRFFDRFRGLLNDRQLRAVKRMLEEGPKGFEGGMTAKKYVGITKTTKATATRDLQTLVELKVFDLVGAGRSVHYTLNLPNE